LRLVHRAPDAGNPGPDVIRLVYADRELTAAQLATTLRLTGIRHRCRL
jgi:hypothetical protein